MHCVFLSAILSVLLFQVEDCFAADSQDLEKNAQIASKIITNSAKKLTTGKALYVQTSWGENAEVKVVRSFSVAKKVAVLYNVIDFLESNDEIIFDSASVLTRLTALSYLSTLVVPATENELIIKDYMDGEISDLKLVLANRLPYGIYRASRKARDDKRTMLLMSNKEFVVEFLRIGIGAEQDPLPKKLANITMMTSFVDICLANLESLCIKL